jgi:hypothetical protein
MLSRNAFAIASLLAVSGAMVANVHSAQAQTFLGPSPYLSFSDSPFSDVDFSYFYLEDFEDGFNVPGVTANTDQVLGPATLTDSVDGDDSSNDGFGSAGHSLYSKGSLEKLTFTFDINVLGELPTHVGLVWTDVGALIGETPQNATGIGKVGFEAFDGMGISLGTIGPVELGDGRFDGTTAEDRFFGVAYKQGISKFTISMNSQDWEVDHLQYGRAVPEPASVLALLTFGTVAMGAARKKRLFQ